MVEERKKETGPYLPLALGLAMLSGGVLTAIVAQVPGVSGSLMVVAALLLGRGTRKLHRRRSSLGLANGETMPETSESQALLRLAEPAAHEGRLLLAIRDNGGDITVAEAAMNTALTVGEADGMLSKLTEGGHLAAKSEEGTLVYALPARSVPKPARRG